jgi:glycosyltransferase involved in cell wall biosynthesis
VLVKYIYPKTKRILTLQSGDLDDARKQKRLQQKFFWKIIHTSPDIITAISTALARRAEKLGVKKDNIYITPNGIDFSKVPGEIEKVPGRVTIVARLSWEKAHNLILDAWPGVLREFPDASLYFVGPDGGEQSKIEEQIKKLNINDSVTLTGGMPHQEALQGIKKSEVFICPSLAEGLGLVFVEAQACGVPPIGTRVGGIPDVIQHEENGLLIEPKSSEAIKKAIIRLLKDKELRNKLRSKGLETCRKFEWKKIINNIDKIYQSL